NEAIHAVHAQQASKRLVRRHELRALSFGAGRGKANHRPGGPSGWARRSASRMREAVKNSGRASHVWSACFSGKQSDLREPRVPIPLKQHLAAALRRKLRIDLPKHAHRILIGLTAHYRPWVSAAIDPWHPGTIREHRIRLRTRA